VTIKQALMHHNFYARRESERQAESFRLLLNYYARLKDVTCAKDSVPHDFPFPRMPACESIAMSFIHIEMMVSPRSL